MRKDRSARRVVIPFAVAIGIVASAGAAAMHAQDRPVTSVGGASILDHAPSDIDLDDLLELPPVPPAMRALASHIENQFGGDARFASVVYSDSRTRLSVYWYGDVPAEMSGLAGSAQSFDVEIVPAAFDPEVLRRTAESIFESWPGVAAESVRPDASGLVVHVSEGHASAVVALSDELPFPVEVREQTFVPAN